MMMKKSSPSIARNMDRLSPSTTLSKRRSRRKTPVVYASASSSSSSSSIRIRSLQNHHGRLSQSVWSSGFLGKQEYQIPPFDFGYPQTPPSSSSSKFEYEARTTATNSTIIRSRKKPKHVRRKYVLDGSKQNLRDMVVVSDADADDASRASKHRAQNRRNRALTPELFDLILGRMVQDSE